jgi:hypothetical protein
MEISRWQSAYADAATGFAPNALSPGGWRGDGGNLYCSVQHLLRRPSGAKFCCTSYRWLLPPSGIATG